MKKFAHLIAGLALSATLPAIAADAPNIALDAAKEYRERARFPEWSQTLGAGVADPIADARLPTRQRQAGPNGAAPVLEVWASSIRYEAGDTVDLFARLDGLDTSSLAKLRQNQLAGWAISGALVQDEVGEIATLAYADDGRGADLVAGDGIHSARLVLDAATAPAVGTAQSVMVMVVAENAAGEVRRAAGGFQYSHPGAALTGNFSQSLKDGTLVLLAETVVAAPGRYHIAGVLSDLAGQPLASAQAAQQLEAGTQWIALNWYGLIFHELAAAGGLQLGSVTLTSTGTMPNALGPVLTDAYSLAAVPLTELTAQPYGDANLLDAAARLEALTLPGTKPAVSKPALF